MEDFVVISAEYCQQMARYNRWMNERLYAVCATLSEAERNADKGAFFKSIHATLNHILYADLAFFARFSDEPANVPELGVILYSDFVELRQRREALDQTLLDWTATLTPQWLTATTTYSSRVDGKTRTLVNWLLVTHMFNHQTHHRGQVTTLLSQSGLDLGPTDLPFMPEFTVAS